MIPSIKKILYATDLSDNARHVFAYAAAIANRFDAEIIILHAVEPISPYTQQRLSEMIGESQWAEMQKNKEQETVDLIRQRLDRFCQEMGSELNACPFQVADILVKRGNAVEAILEQSRSNHCDLIVMGTHGHGTLADVFVGSTARRVIRRSQVPVMVAHLPENQP
jgi:nucleotide-binding universal stress UspA family protein